MRVGIICLLLCAACSPTGQAKVDAALRTPTGALFCHIHAEGGGVITVAVVNAAALAYAGPAAPAVVIASGASKQFVDDACAAAHGVPAPPPLNPDDVPKVVVSMPNAR